MMAALCIPLWLTRDAADSMTAQARRAALEMLAAGLPTSPAERRDALLRASQAAWVVSAISAASLIAGNASAIAAAYSLRGKIAGVLLMASADGPLVVVAVAAANVGGLRRGGSVTTIERDRSLAARLRPGLARTGCASLAANRGRLPTICLFVSNAPSATLTGRLANSCFSWDFWFRR